MGEELTCFVQKLSQMELEGYAPSTLPCKGSVFLTIPKPLILTLTLSVLPVAVYSTDSIVVMTPRCR